MENIFVQKPFHTHAAYIMIIRIFSIVLQGVVGPDYRFIVIEIGAYGKESDGRLFSNSNLSRIIQNEFLNVASEHRLLNT